MKMQYREVKSCTKQGQSRKLLSLGTSIHFFDDDSKGVCVNFKRSSQHSFET